MFTFRFVMSVLDPVVDKAVLEAADEPEYVCQRRPLALLVEVETATEAMPDLYGPRVYALRPRARKWSLDKAGHAQVRRIGFALVPAFGGTARAYCGSTLDA